MLKKIVIIGAGEIGQAIGKILQNKKGIIIEFWDKKPIKVSGQKFTAKIISSTNFPGKDADFLFLCVPSWAIGSALTKARAQFNKRTIVISLAKGIEEKTLKTMDGLLEELLPDNWPFALLTGPMLAEEISDREAGIGLVSSSQIQIFHALTKLFAKTNLRLEYSADVYGSALVSVLKNIYAIGLGIAEALNLGGNTKGWLTQKALKEMAEIIRILGGCQETVFGLAGLGDLVATGFSPYSSNRELGVLLVNSGEINLKSEGLVSLPSFLRLLSRKRKKIDDFHFLKALQEIILENKNPRIIFKKLSN